MVKFLEILKSTMTKPTLYGWYHLMCLAIVLGLSIFLGIRFRNASEKKIRIFLIISGVAMILFEIYKQFIFSYSINDGVVTWSYQWRSFPFQFCSTPMYVALLAGILKKGKLQESLYSFLATFGLFGGGIVMFIPSTVFMKYIAINIHTMFHHGMMVVIGVVLLSSKAVKIEHKTILKAVAVFISLTAIALLADCVYVWCGGTQDFNMFYISPYRETELIVFDKIQQNTHYIVFLLSYLVGFSLAGYAVLLIAMFFKWIFSKTAKNQTTS